MLQRFVLLSALLIGGLLSSIGQAESADIIPFKIHEKQLKNGLKVIVIPTGFPNLVSIQIPVQTGSRNEVEDGKTGFAHFFEHMMFRGTKTVSAEQYQSYLAAMGARQNAYTSSDLTNYYTSFAKEDLELMIRLEADRFQNLEYGESAFKTEARAVLGEYNMNSANPRSKFWEALKAKAFKTHTYKHTTMGFLADIKDMPNQFEYSKVFFDRWYRPEYTSIIIAGDVNPQESFKIVEKYWSDWEPGSFKEKIPQEKPAKGPLYTHVNWENTTPAQLSVGFRGPAFDPDSVEYAALSLFFEMSFGEDSELYQKLVLKDQKALSLYGWAARSKDPDLYLAGASLKDNAALLEVRDLLLEQFALAKVQLTDANLVKRSREAYRNSLTRRLDNTDTIASTMASFVHFERRADTINRFYRALDKVTPTDIRKAAKKYFTDSNLIVASLANNEVPKGLDDIPELEDMLPKPVKLAKFDIVEQKNDIPFLNIQLRFDAGSANDPKGKEGLASLAAAMISEAGSAEFEYEKIAEEFYPLAASFDAKVDKEVTKFTIRTHTQHFDKTLDIALGALLKPGYRSADFERLKTSQLQALTTSLRNNNDEELGKERLQELNFLGSSYAHPSLGSEQGINSITIDDVKNFIANAYTTKALTLGINGDYSPAQLDNLKRRLSQLPQRDGFDKLKVEPVELERKQVNIVEKNTRATAISMGFPIDVTRSDSDFAALWLVRSWLGEHRSSMARLFQRIREIRGLNYGSYAYIEAFPGGMYQFFPPSGINRQKQLFEIWIRPVVPENAPMALRVALYEIDQLVKNGLTKEQFEATRDYLMKNVYVMTATQDQQLGYALDSKWHDMDNFAESMRKSLAKLDLDDINEAIEDYLSNDNWQIVIVTKEAEALRNQLLKEEVTAIKYDGEKPQSLLDEDKAISNIKLNLKPEQITITPVDKVFSGSEKHDLAKL